MRTWDLAFWRDRQLDEVAYPYLVIDARYEHVRIAGQVTRQGMLIVKDVREDGHRDLLAVDVADTESEATIDKLFRRNKERGSHVSTPHDGRRLLWLGTVESAALPGRVLAVLLRAFPPQFGQGRWRGSTAMLS